MKSNVPQQTEASLFAWDGFSIRVPADWNLSDYTFTSKMSGIQMEDDSSIRMEMEWVRVAGSLKHTRLQKRCDRVAREMAESGAESAAIGALPAGWTATMFSMQDGKRLLTAYRLVPGCPFFCLFKLHFPAASRREPPRMIRRIASSFRLHEDGPVPWRFYDVSFKVNRDFRLVNTSFHAGRKLMSFEWRLRRLYVWFFSLADTVLKDKTMEEWCADFLNGFRGIQGPKFIPGREGMIITRFTFRYPFGQFEEIFRWCFRYYARCVHLPESNKIALYVFNYRKQQDLAMLSDLQKSLSPKQQDLNP